MPHCDVYAASALLSIPPDCIALTLCVTVFAGQSCQKELGVPHSDTYPGVHNSLSCAESVQFGRLTVSFNKMPLPGYGIRYNQLRLLLSPWPQGFSEDFTVLTSKSITVGRMAARK